MTPKSLLLCIVAGVCATTSAASGLRGGEVAIEEDSQSQRMLPEGQPNYGLTKSEHFQQYGYVDQPGMYGEYGYYDGGEYERGTYGNPWGDANYYTSSGFAFQGQGYSNGNGNGNVRRPGRHGGNFYGGNGNGQYSQSMSSQNGNGNVNGQYYQSWNRPQNGNGNGQHYQYGNGNGQYYQYGNGNGQYYQYGNGNGNGQFYQYGNGNGSGNGNGQYYQYGNGNSNGQYYQSWNRPQNGNGNGNGNGWNRPQNGNGNGWTDNGNEQYDEDESPEGEYDGSMGGQHNDNQNH